MIPSLIAALWLTFPFPPQDDACLACHGDKDLRSEKGRSVYVDPAKQAGSVHAPLGCTSCHTTIRDFPHPKRIARVNCAACHSEETAQVPKSVHGILGEGSCASCHGPPHEIARSGTPQPGKGRSATALRSCAACHTDAVREYESGVHAGARKRGDVEGATCLSCHGPAHKIVPSSDPASPTAKKNLAATCGACHANADFLARHQIPFARPVEAFRLSVHGRAVEAGNLQAASCSDCHASHGVFPARDARSKINRWNVPPTCGACHSDILRTYNASVHGAAVMRGVSGAPVCTDCHGEHSILAPSEPQSLVNPARVSSVTCGRCHADERLATRYNLPRDKVPAFEDSYHGLAARAGSQSVANCASCHGVHNILPSSDPASTVHPANLAKTCGACHPGAGTRFGIGRVHVRPATASEHTAVKWIRVAYLVLIPISIAFMVLHNALDFFAKLRRGVGRPAVAEQVPRMNLHFRIAHWLVVLSFPVLVVTGFALKFPEAWWAAPVLHWESQFALRGSIHRVAGVVLVAALLYHVVHLIASRRDRAILRYARPGIGDLRDLWSTVRFNLGLAPERPAFGALSYGEKFEYLAFLWGTVVMALSGFLLWFNDFTLRNFPKWVSDAATALHYYEAILATAAILFWHFYFVIFDPEVYPMEMAWLTGRISAEHLRHTRPAYYLELMQKRAARAPEPEAAPRDQGRPSRESAAPASSAEQAPADDASAEGDPPSEAGRPPERNSPQQ
jgi:cytochrome b subunit of formate dehydrogenase/protein-arginine kinase activator protein McsA